MLIFMKTATCQIEANQAVYPLNLTRSNTVYKEGSVKPLPSFSPTEEEIYIFLFLEQIRFDMLNINSKFEYI